MSLILISDIIYVLITGEFSKSLIYVSVIDIFLITLIQKVRRGSKD